MNTLHRFLMASFLSSLALVYASTASAEQYYSKPAYQQQYYNQPYQQQDRPRTYGQKIGTKALNGLVNIPTGMLEVPKGVINLANSDGSNFIYALVGGTLEGSLNALYRTSMGVVDLATFLIPTQPIVQPQYVWEDFYDEKTTYGDVFRLDENAQSLHYRVPE